MKKVPLHINKKRLALIRQSSLRGFSLVELIVSVSIFLVFVIALNGAMGKVNITTQNSTHRERAVILAEEALEASRNIRDADFGNLTDGTYGLSTSGNIFSFSGSSDITDIFTRSITISTINGSEKKVKTIISWADSSSPNNTVSLETYLTNWRAPLNIGLTIDKIVINHGGTKTPNDFLPNDLSTQAWDNTVDPPVQNIINIPIIFAPSTMTLGPGTYDFITSNDPNYNLTLSADCLSNTITLLSGDAKLCNITYEENNPNVIPTVTTPTVASIGTTTATLGAEVISLGIPASISERGTCWGTTALPTTNCVAEGGTTTGVFTQARTGFTAGTLYYYRGYATNATGTAYSADGTFTTNPANIIPTVTTPTVASIGTTTATLGAEVISLGIPASISERGTCWGTTALPTTNCVAEGGTTTGVFTQARTGFTAGTLYYYRGYATNATGTAYSADGTFTTIAQCVVASALVGTPTIFNSAGAITAPVLKPTGVVVGDIMFAHILHFNATDRLSTIPIGWNPAGGTGRHKNGTYNQALYYKVAGASEGTTYTFGLSASSKFAVTISAYRGCFDPTNPIDVFSNVEYVISNTTYRAGTINLPSVNSTVLMFPSIYSTTVRTFANPTTQGGGWTEDYDHGSVAPDFSRAGYRKMITASGATGVIDSIGTTGTTIKHAFAVALHPL